MDHNRTAYWDSWAAERARVARETQAKFDRILAEGYDALGEPVPERTASFRANRDRKIENEDS